MQTTPQKHGRGSWRRIVPATVLVVVTSLVTVSFAVADNPVVEVAGGAAARYVPPEGYVHWSLAVEPGSPDIRRVAESARSTGYTEAIALPESQTSHVLAALSSDVRTTQFWREITHVLDGEDQSQLTDLYTLTDDGVSLIAGYGGSVGWVYSPPLVQLPSDVAPGVSWTGEGDAMPFGLITYAHSAGAVAPNNAVLVANAQAHGVDVSECIQIDAETQLFDESGVEIVLIVQSELWCEGRGRVAAVANVEEVSSEYLASSPLPETTGVDANSAPRQWSDPGSWVRRGATVTLDDGFFGANPFNIGLADAPRATASGLLITANTNTADVVALEPSGDRLLRAWYAHPGGDIVTFATVGDVTVVSTGLRRLVAYDAKGRRLWQHPVPELVVAPPTAAGDGRVVSVGLDGTVTMLDAVTGEIVWATSVGADVDLSAAIAGGRVIVIDRAGVVSALDAATGEAAWSMDSEPAGELRVFGDVVAVVGDDGWLRTIAASDGEVTQSWRYGGSWRALVAANGSVVLATDEAILAVDPESGEELWRGEGVESAIGDGETIIVFRGETAVVLDAAGATVTSWDVPASLLWSTRYVVAVGNSFVLMHSGSDATIVGAR